MANTPKSTTEPLPTTATKPPGVPDTARDEGAPRSSRTATSARDAAGTANTLSVDTQAARPAGPRAGRGPDDHDTNANGGPIGAPHVRARQNARAGNPDVLPGQREDAPNVVNQPAEIARRGRQNPDTGRRPIRYGSTALNLKCRPVVYTTFATTEDGEHYLRQVPAVIIEPLDEDGLECDLFVQDGSTGRVNGVRYAKDPQTADNNTWSHLTHFAPH